MNTMQEINWSKIELDYRAGILPLLEIAKEHGITHGAINKCAKRDGWARDLAAKINSRADQLVSSSQESKWVSNEFAL